jgi:hypothetical protein
MTEGRPDASKIQVGAPVIAYDGSLLGEVREVHPHYFLVHRGGEHDDLDVPMHAVIDVADGHIRTHVNRDSVTAVDDEETPRRRD